MTIGTAILSTLNGQRRLIEGAVGHHDAVAVELDDSETTMRRMMRRAVWRRVKLGILASLLMAAILYVWWLKWGFGGNSGAHDGG